MKRIFIYGGLTLLLLTSYQLAGSHSKAPEQANDGRLSVKSAASASAVYRDNGDNGNSGSRKQLSLSQLRQKYSDTFKYRGSAAERKIALTFDDVPDGIYTAQVLDVLKTYHVKATFFVVGYRAAKYPALVKRMVREGHVIGNHSFNHPLLSRVPVANFAAQLAKTDAVIRPLAGYSPRLFRPPYGEINEQQIRWARRNRYLIVNWDVDSNDWRSIKSAKVITNVLSTIRPGSIVLQHAGGGYGEDLSGTVRALPVIILKARSRSYRLVTLPELFHVPENR